MLILGIRIRWRVLDQGTFFCPSCGGDRKYAHKQAKRWFTLFFVPLVPLNAVGDTYECHSCHRTFNERVLHTPTTSDLASRLQWAMRLSVCSMVLDDDPHHQPSRQAAIAAVRSTGATHYSETHLDADLRAIDLTQLNAAAEHLADDFEPAGKEHYLLTSGRVAVASGCLSPTNHATLEQLGRSIGLTPAHVHGVLHQLIAEAAPHPLG
jgi:hypothetical protein